MRWELAADQLTATQVCEQLPFWGKQGWELVSCCPMGHDIPDYFLVTFKRPHGQLSDQEALDELRGRCAAKTQAKVAMDLGLSPQYVSDILTGRRSMSSEVADKLGLVQVIRYDRKGV